MPKVSAPVFTVAQVNRYMKRLMEEDALLAGLFVEGELSNVNRHGAGHIYFTLKDESAAVSGVLFESHAAGLAFSPESGMKVTVFGRFSLYEKTGQYRLYAECMSLAGVGSLQKAYEQLRDRLREEGLFAPEKKKPIPAYAACVAVITSPSGAAVRDIIQTIRQRNPAVRIVVAPALVQGADAAADIARAIREVNAWGKADVIILGRGGGSMEDLWAFNEEIAVRAVSDSKIPIISAVGHETDVTITDFAADYRAATPTAAAAAAAYDFTETVECLRYVTHRLNTLVPEIIYERQMHVRTLIKNMNRAVTSHIGKERATLADTTVRLVKSSPHALWRQGMALVRGLTGAPVTSAKGLKKGTALTIEWTDGSVMAEVREVADNA
jgi:exodeoxyribonuclease VII large subunit